MTGPTFDLTWAGQRGDEGLTKRQSQFTSLTGHLLIWHGEHCCTCAQFTRQLFSSEIKAKAVSPSGK